MIMANPCAWAEVVTRGRGLPGAVVAGRMCPLLSPAHRIGYAEGMIGYDFGGDS